jgi:hypothetical protein
MAAIASTEVRATDNTVYIPLNGSTAAGVALAAGSYRVWVTDRPTYITSVSVLRATGAADGTAQTWQAGYSPVTTATSSALTTTNFGDSAVTDTAVLGFNSLPIAVSGVTDDVRPLLLTAGNYVGIVATNAATNAKVLGVQIKYRCP